MKWKSETKFRLARTAYIPLENYEVSVDTSRMCSFLASILLLLFTGSGKFLFEHVFEIM